MASRDRPKAKDTPAKPILSPASTALPQPPNTSTKVPTSSAMYLRTAPPPEKGCSGKVDLHTTLGLATFATHALGSATVPLPAARVVAILQAPSAPDDRQGPLRDASCPCRWIQRSVEPMRQ